MVANRARTLGNTRGRMFHLHMCHFYPAPDLDLSRLNYQQQLARLSPAPVVAGDGVRKIYLYLDLGDPLVLAPR
jgi:hypothetical protein